MLRIPKLPALTCIFMLFLTSTALGQSTVRPSVPSDEKIRQILTDRIGNYADRIGIVVGVIEPAGRRIVAYGSSDAAGGRVLDGDTVFEIGSITKVFTALLLADMAQQGTVALAIRLRNIFQPG